eukprot:8644833-Pyramimonas_sp.AAC.1
MLSRVWSMSREPWSKAWSSRTEPSWDAAVRGNSSLREAFRRALDEEVAGILNVSYGHALTDIDGYYDNMLWLKLSRAALRLGFPPTILYMELLQCAHPRTLNQIGSFSMAFEPTCSIIQGLRAGTRLARAMTFFIMEVITTSQVRCSHRLWIDDISQTTMGSESQVKKDLVQCVAATARGLHSQGLKVASKSTVVCTKLSLARDVVRTLRLRGITMTAARSTSYLGVDLGAGVRHSRAERRKRAARRLNRHRKVVKYKKVIRRTAITSRLERQGAQAA